MPQTKTGFYSKDIATHLVADYEAALADPDLIAVREELAVCKARGAELLRAIAEAEGNERRVAALWGEFFALLEHVRALAETERRRLEAGHKALTSERVMLLVAALVDAVRRHVDDRGTLDAISRDISRLVDGRGSETGGGDRTGG